VSEWERLSRIFSPEAANAGFGISCVIVVAGTLPPPLNMSSNILFSVSFPMIIRSQLKCHLESVIVAGTISWPDNYQFEKKDLGDFENSFVDSIFGEDMAVCGKTHTYIRVARPTLVGYGYLHEVETDGVLNMLDNITKKSKNTISLRIHEHIKENYQFKIFS
tara:strand:+ start:1531 stop:2019 length:489 start_codon:yes stop_codon:yes gene_type:complete